MSTYELRQFVANTSGGLSTVSLVNLGSRGMAHMEEEGDYIFNSVLVLRNGTKYNVNGTRPAVMAPGQARAVYFCTGTNMQHAIDNMEPLLAIAGRSGVLYGVEYTVSGVATHTCSAVVISAKPISMMDKLAPHAGTKHAVNCELVFDRLSNWS